MSASPITQSYTQSEQGSTGTTPITTSVLRISLSAPPGLESSTGPMCLVRIDNVLSPEAAQTYLEQAALVHRPSTMCSTPRGPCEIPRRQICYTRDGAPYKYSGRKHPTTVYPAHVLSLIQVLLEAFQQVVPDNPYRTVDTATDLCYSPLQDRGGSISAHRDDENPHWGLVLNYSVGQTRTLRVRYDYQGNKGSFINLDMPHNSLVVMYGPGVQKYYTHQVDKLKPSQAVGTRYSLNVRCVQSP